MANGTGGLLQRMNDIAAHGDAVAKWARTTPEQGWLETVRDDSNPPQPHGVPPHVFVKLGYGMDPKQFTQEMQTIYATRTKAPEFAKNRFRPIPRDTPREEIAFVGPTANMGSLVLAQKTIDIQIAMEEAVDYPNNLTPEQLASLENASDRPTARPLMNSKIRETESGKSENNETVPADEVILDHELVIHYDYKNSPGHFIVELKDHRRSSLYFGKYPSSTWHSTQILKEFMPKIWEMPSDINEFHVRRFVAFWKDTFSFLSGEGEIRNDKARVMAGIKSGKIESSNDPARIDLEYFRISKSEYEKILGRIRRLEKSPTKYVLTKRNCADFAQNIIGDRAKLEDLFPPDVLANSWAGLYVACRTGPNERCNVPADSLLWPLAERILFEE